MTCNRIVMAVTEAVTFCGPSSIIALGACRPRLLPRCQFARLDQVSLNDLDMALAFIAHDVRRPLLLGFLLRHRRLLLDRLQIV